MCQRPGGPLHQCRGACENVFSLLGDKPLSSPPPSTRISEWGWHLAHMQISTQTLPLCLRVPHQHNLCPRQKSRKGWLVRHPPSGNQCAGPGAPFGGWGWGTGDGDAELSTNAAISAPTPNPSPREPAGNRKCLLPRLARGDRDGGALCVQPCSPLILGLQDFILQTRGGGCAAHRF